MKTEKQARLEFAHYFICLKESMASEGGRVSKSAEWERRVEHWIEEGDAPSDAVNWKCPRSLESVISQES